MVAQGVFVGGEGLLVFSDEKLDVFIKVQSTKKLARVEHDAGGYQRLTCASWPVDRQPPPLLFTIGRGLQLLAEGVNP